MKILQIMAGGKQGGAETAFVDMCIALHHQGEHIEVITRANDLRVSQLRHEGITVHTARFGGALDFFTRVRIARIIKDFGPDIVQTWMARGSHHTPGWHPRLRVPRYHVVARLGGYYNLKYFRSADYFVTITPHIRDYLIENGIAPTHVRHINNFAETETPVRKVARADYDVPDDAPLLLALGRLHESKGFDMLINAMTGLGGAYLWIAGEGPLRPGLEQMISDLKLESRVRLLGWRSDRAALFEACDICVFPSRYEPFGTVFVQAWAAGRPVITSDADGPKQFVRDGEDGLVFPVDDTAALRHAIERLIVSPDMRQKLVENGRIRYHNEFTKEQTLAAYLEYYKQICASAGHLEAGPMQKV